MEKNANVKKVISIEGLAAIVIIGIFFSYLCGVMGLVNMFNTLISTAHDLLINTVFFIMGITVLAGAFGSVLSEFGIISILNRILSFLMKPLYKMPGAAVLGVVTTYLSDNPAIITLANDKGFKRYFKKYQLPALTNVGTAFGMGLVVTSFMIAQQSPIGESFIGPALIGNIGAIIGSIVSVRIMLYFTKKEYGVEEMAVESNGSSLNLLKYREVREGNLGSRLLESLLEGGKSGVDLGLSIIPGVLIICTFVMMLTNGPSASGVYTGSAYEGVGLFTYLADKLNFILDPLFGFSSNEAIAVPITSLGSVGAAIGMVPKMLKEGLIGGNEIAIFTAMGMCWSGYLSTHVAMMDSLKCRKLTGKAIISHTFGGLIAGIMAHWIYVIWTSVS
ncbi:hypothetical protein HZI73_10205 [Vallitalea pronyensis]|uniref:Nucleoside transporter/FeoB GTPase Gate domain-containing protein n=1 Tax=Vallitalea pronyensis TaxID=1348613 RepID=A0A8J8SGI8_9FIRM|nr:hypothetical protein HZI73_10205 [Vallitalea pronyensis]